MDILCYLRKINFLTGDNVFLTGDNAENIMLMWINYAERKVRGKKR